MWPLHMRKGRLLSHSSWIALGPAGAQRSTQHHATSPQSATCKPSKLANTPFPELWQCLAKDWLQHELLFSKSGKSLKAREEAVVDACTLQTVMHKLLTSQQTFPLHDVDADEDQQTRHAS